MKTNLLRLFTSVATLALAVFAATPARAQWLTQTITLKPGWNAVYLHVDASYTNLDNLVGADSNSKIKEVWLWQPPVSTMQFTSTPQQPSTPNSQWAVWDKSTNITDTLTKLIGNAAYLVNNTNTADYVWTIKGKPVPPRYQWTTTGLNFIGFPTPSATSSTLDFDTFLGPAPAFQSTAEIYRYPGGNLGSTNPARIFSPLFRNTFVKRGEAFWIRAGTSYNRYFGPVEVNLQNSSGVQFADDLGTYSVRLKNVTTTSRMVTMSLIASESVPVTTPAQTAIVSTPPMLVRGVLNPTNLTYGSSTLSAGGSTNFTLAAQGQPGSELEVVLGLNRSLMTQPAGSLYAGVLRFADSANLEQVDVPVTATVGGTSGLWVGGASVTQVGQYLKTYASVANASDFANQVAVLNQTVSPPPGLLWTAHSTDPNSTNTTRNWLCLASSVDGTKLVAGHNNGQLYTSSDSGVTWTARNSSRKWRGVASSADGTKLVAVVDSGGFIYTSTDSGTNWAQRGGTNDWRSVASSADGTKLVAGVNAGQLYTSTDSGTNWTARDSSRAWNSVASSADGTKLFAANQGGWLYTSINSGTNWVQRTSDSTRNWLGAASSTDGTRLVAGIYGDKLYTSTDSGVTWTARMTDATRNWHSVASSSDGLALVAGIDGGQLYTSTDGGTNWTARLTGSTGVWKSVASSADGTKLLAGWTGGQLYTSAGVFNPTYTLDTNSNRILSTGPTFASYVATNTNLSLAAVARPYPLRLILHNDSAASTANLLQRVYYGPNVASNLVVATREQFLDPAALGSARRISAAHLPFSHTNTFWPRASGTLGLGSSLVFNVNLDYNDHASNPFLHTYHPDHDNLKADFKTVEVQGAESYSVTRTITLTFTAPAADFASLTAVRDTLGGTYAEVITVNGSGSNTRQFTLTGTFSLNRISSIATLTTQ